MDDREIEVQFSSGQEIFLSPKISREVLSFTQPQIQYVPIRIKQMERETDRLSIPSVVANNERNYIFNLHPSSRKYLRDVHGGIISVIYALI
jgi:hypothetical protein